jgi:hypothetical protein
MFWLAKVLLRDTFVISCSNTIPYTIWHLGKMGLIYIDSSGVERIIYRFKDYLDLLLITYERKKKTLALLTIISWKILIPMLCTCCEDPVPCLFSMFTF